MNYLNVKPRETSRMSLEEFLNIGPVFCQRDEQQRLTSIAKLLRENPIPTQLEIAIGKYPDGRLVILDGNTRAEVWRINKNTDNYSYSRAKRKSLSAPIPREVEVSMYDIINEGDGCDEYARRLYYTFDSQKSTETTKNKITGVHRSLGLSFNSPKLQSGTYVKALQFASMNSAVENHKNIWETIDFFKESLISLDSIGLNQNFTQDIIAASLMLLKFYGDANERLLKALRYIKSGVQNDGYDERYGNCPIAVIQKEWEGGASPEKVIPKKGTSGTDMPIQISFILFCIKKFMSKQRIRVKADGKPDKRSIKGWEYEWKNFWEVAESEENGDEDFFEFSEE